MSRMDRRLRSLGVAGILALAAPAEAVRVKDLSFVQGPRESQLVGYGLVVGLPGTGDRFDPSTQKSVANMLGRFGIRVGAKELRSRNVASVLVTATLPPFPELIWAELSPSHG